MIQEEGIVSIRHCTFAAPLTGDSKVTKAGSQSHRHETEYRRRKSEVFHLFLSNQEYTVFVVQKVSRVRY